MPDQPAGSPAHENPFAVQTPEDLRADVMVSLFVDVFSDFSMVEKVGHTFLHGPRGSGKSMMFRFLEPDCQLERDRTRPLVDQPFFGVYLPIKKTDLAITELVRLEDTHSAVVLNEHLLTTAVASRTFSALNKAGLGHESDEKAEALANFYERTFVRLVRQTGWSEELPAASTENGPAGLVETMEEVCDQMYLRAVAYLRRLSFSPQPLPYQGPLAGYLDFMVPLVKVIRQLPFMPQGPVYLLIDDADNLNLTQTQILNTWVSYRTSQDLSLKISTQLRYKTYATVLATKIEAPHDYSEVFISGVYTTSRGRGNYKRRVREIVRRRLEKAGLQGITPEEFFPENEEQETRIQEFRKQIRAEHEVSGRGYRPSDDVTRYARPDYIKSLRGTAKSGHTYSYAGFDQLVHISDGIIRHFLEAASRMWAVTKAHTPAEEMRDIPPSIQNQVVRDLADELVAGFDKLLLDEDSETVKRLRNLILALGHLFQQIMLSDRSERRVFSIAFSDAPDEEVRGVLKLGVHLGYLQKSLIGNKEGTGKTEQYIFSRRLAPHFTLDPTSFAGYQFIRNEVVRKALSNPRSLVRAVKLHGTDSILEKEQPSLFEEET